MISRALVLLTALLCSNALLPAARRCRATALRSSSSDVWQAMKVIDLKAACRRRGLKVSGTKAELVARLSDAPETKDVVVSPQRTEPVLDEPSVADARVGFVDSSVREEHELEVGSAKIKCFTTASRLVAQEKAGKVEGGRGVLLLPDSDGNVAAEVADRLAFDADATVLYPDVDEEYDDAAALLEAASAFFAEQRVSATGAVGFGKSADAALLAAASFDAVVAWAPSSKELAAAATAPVCVFTSASAVELRDALDASKASDYVVRVVDDATDPRVEEQLLLGAAWLQLYLTVGDATTGPRAKSLWAD